MRITQEKINSSEKDLRKTKEPWEKRRIVNK